MQHPSVFVILVNYKNTTDTIACIESLRAVMALTQIAVVDNASGGDAVEQLEQIQGITLLTLPVNVGFAGGNNIGIRSALAAGADFIWLLNNDTIVRADALTLMLSTAQEDTRIGVVGSKIYYYHDQKRLWYAGATINRLGKARHVGLGELDSGQYDGPAHDTGYITGCSMLIRREAIEQVGLLSEDYFMYYEDTDWSIRAQQAGWRTVINPRAVLWHKEGASSGGRWRDPSAAQDYYDLRNGWLFVDRHCIGVWKTVGKLYLFVRLLIKFGRMMIGRDSNVVTKMMAQIRALYHAWIGVVGPMPAQRSAAKP